MPTDPNPLAERVANSIKELSDVANDLNLASDELGKAISAIDTVLQGLSLGLATWTTLAKGDSTPNGTDYWSRDLGYAKVGNRWGVALRTVSGEYNYPDEEDCDTWLFNDAPRWLRTEAVEKIPDLIEALIKTAKTTTQNIQTKTAQANELATAMARAAGSEKRVAGTTPVSGYSPRPLDPVPQTDAPKPSVPRPSLPLSNVVRVDVKLPPKPGGEPTGRPKGGR
jgi:hypothetical protein